MTIPTLCVECREVLYTVDVPNLLAKRNWSLCQPCECAIKIRLANVGNRETH
jgi:hypothetical protein